MAAKWVGTLNRVNGVNEPMEFYELNVGIGDKVNMFANFLENTGVHTDYS